MNWLKYLLQTVTKLPTIPLQRSVYHRCSEKSYVFSHSLNRISALHAKTKIEKTIENLKNVNDAFQSHVEHFFWIDEF